MSIKTTLRLWWQNWGYQSWSRGGRVQSPMYYGKGCWHSDEQCNNVFLKCINICIHNHNPLLNRLKIKNLKKDEEIKK